MVAGSYSDAPALLRGYLNYSIAVKGRSPLTVSQYYTDLKMFLRFLKHHRGLTNAPFDETPISDVDDDFIKSVTYNDIIEFLSYTKTQRDNQAAARARKSSAIRGFYKYLQHQNIIKESPARELETPKLKRSLPKYLTLDDSVDLLDAVDGPFKARDYCMITLFLNCGMRLSELVGINITDIKDDLLTVTGKGNKQRTLFLNQMCRDAIDEYLAVRPVEGVKDREALFLSRLGRRISPKTVQHVVYTALDRAGLGGKHLSVHKLRHTAATLMYQNGADVRVLKDVLGHENLNTTQIYTHVRDEQVQAAMESNPLGKVKRRADKKKQNENGEE
ncbi:MAG: tyrosine recombinase XerC [Clostridia bacterium]|nr:tyrosine recombinase XerC [Clostridia bacterium]